MTTPLSRRGFLWAGLAAAASGGLALVPGPPAAGLKVLSAAEVSVVEALAAVLFPVGVFPVHGGDGGTAPLVDDLLDHGVDAVSAAGIRGALAALELGTLISRGMPFHALPRDEAADVFAVWASEDPMPRRLASDSLRLAMSIGFLRRPEVASVIGWRAGCA